MGVPTSEVGYTPAMPRREEREVHKGHVVALGGGVRYGKYVTSGAANRRFSHKNFPLSFDVTSRILKK